MDIPNLCAKASTNSDLNSDLDCSDVDFDSDSQNKPTVLEADEKTATQRRDEACEKLKKLFFARVSSDSTETDCSIEFKPHITTSESNSLNKRDSPIELVHSLVSSTEDIAVAKEHAKLPDCVPSNDCHSVSVADVVDANASPLLNSTEHST